jgi:hypothetical protein
LSWLLFLRFSVLSATFSFSCAFSEISATVIMAYRAQKRALLRERRVNRVNGYYLSILSGDLDPRIPRQHRDKFLDMIEADAPGLKRKAKLWAGKLVKMDEEQNERHRQQVRQALQQRDANRTQQEQAQLDAQRQAAFQQAKAERVAEDSRPIAVKNTAVDEEHWTVRRDV